MTTPHKVLTFPRRVSYQESVRKQRDCQEEAAPDPDDAIMTDMKWLVAKACVLLGSVERAEAVLMNRLAMALSAKKLGSK